MNYDKFFETVTGRAPFPYQARLGTEPWPTLLDIPTGLGKTAAAIVAWLYKRLGGDPTTGLRLIYCLPMRVLVHQTAQVATNWCEAAAPLFEQRDLPAPTVHVLMGGDVDEEWQHNPEHSAIIVGTQDMLLSRALNRGFAMSRYMWPVHFALLNNNSFWIFDETQLMGVAIETSAQLQGLRTKLGVLGGVHSLWMSATLGDAQLRTVDHPRPTNGWLKSRLESEDLSSSLVQARVGAKKPIQELDDVVLNSSTEVHSYARKLAARVAVEHDTRGGLTLVIVNRVQRAQALYQALQELDGVTSDDVALVHSRFRRLDRSRHEQLLLERSRPRIVVATQALEAGVDVSSRTLFTELAPWSSLVQRFGRCNRYGEEEAAVFWIDIQSDDPKADTTLPYDAAELTQSRRLLSELDETARDAGPQALQGLQYHPAEVVRPVLRRRDLLELFDTTADLSGDDIDVSRYVRDANDTDVQFYWRHFESEPDGTLPPPQRDELCRVSVHSARQFATKLDQRYRKDKARNTPLGAWRWNPLEKVWQRESALRAGQVLLLHPTAGGYDPDLGWTGEVGLKQPTPPTAPDDPTRPGESTYDDDPASQFLGGRWVRLSDHLGHVRDEAERVGRALHLDDFTDALRTAGLWHDVGKAHPAFQDKLLSPVAELPSAQPVGPGPWAKSNHQFRSTATRPYFRHELASALAWLTQGSAPSERFRNLVAYLVAAHHGKVRLSIRALPGEAAPAEQDRLFARGVWDGDTLLALELADERSLENVALDLSVMRLGSGSWLERTLSLRDAPDLGPFRLALLEMLVRVADWRASRTEQAGGYDA